MSRLNRLSAICVPRLASLLPALLLAACASTTEFVRTSIEAAPEKPAVRVLVAGVTTDDDLRRRYENVFEQELKRAGLSGTGSHRLIPSTRGMTMDAIRARMHEANAEGDAVLHVQLSGLLPAPALSPTDIPADSAPARTEINGIAVTLNAPRDGQVRGALYDVELQANLYALPSRRLLWTAITRTHEASRVEDIARSHARAVVRALQEARFLANP